MFNLNKSIPEDFLNETTCDLFESPESFAMANADELFTLAEIVHTFDMCDETMMTTFVRFIIERNDQLLIRQLVAKFMCRPHLYAAFKSCVYLFNCRRMWLQTEIQFTAHFSWHMPHATFASHPRVEEFLRGPANQITITRAFSDTQDARLFVRKLMAVASADANRSFSCEATVASGSNTSVNSSSNKATTATTTKTTSSKIQVVITKTRSYFDELCRLRPSYERELSDINHFLANGSR